MPGPQIPLPPSQPEPIPAQQPPSGYVSVGSGFGIPNPRAVLSAGPPRTPEELNEMVSRLTIDLAYHKAMLEQANRSRSEAQATVTRLMQEHNSLVMTNERTVDALERIADSLETLVQRGG
jgi:hypothetical protein